MRHKLLDCIREYMGTGTVKGVVEIDETFETYIYKGNHKKSGFIMPRSARHRGGEVKVRGISHEQVYIATAIDRSLRKISSWTINKLSVADTKRVFIISTI